MRILCVSILLFLHSALVYGQENIKTYDLAKGEVLDILLISTRPGTDDLFKDYLKEVFPHAEALGFQPIPGYKITGYTEGNAQPTSLILGKWGNLTNREAFLDGILEQVPDFHERRHAIWTQFSLTYYELPQDTHFEINRDDYLVLTAYWADQPKAFERYKKEWHQKITNTAGSLILELTEGKSPFGYYYQPDYMALTSWPTKADFEQFRASQPQQEGDGYYRVDQLIID